MTEVNSRPKSVEELRMMAREQGLVTKTRPNLTGESIGEQANIEYRVVSAANHVIDAKTIAAKGGNAAVELQKGAVLELATLVANHPGAHEILRERQRVSENSVHP